MDVQLATTEALAARQRSQSGVHPGHVRSIRNMPRCWPKLRGFGRDIQAVRARIAARCRQHGGAGAHSRQARQADAREFERVKIHPRVGADILREVPFGAPFASRALSSRALGRPWIPAGLRGDSIPLGARILTIADVFSTLQTDRPIGLAAFGIRGDQYSARTVRGRVRPRLVDRLPRGWQPPAAPRCADEPTKRSTRHCSTISEAHREEQIPTRSPQALGSSLGVHEAMALIRDKVIGWCRL